MCLLHDAKYDRMVCLRKISVSDALVYKSCLFQLPKQKAKTYQPSVIDYLKKPTSILKYCTTHSNTPKHSSSTPPCLKSSSKNPPTTSGPPAPPAGNPTTGNANGAARTSWAPSQAGSNSTPLRKDRRGDHRPPGGTWCISATSSK